MVRGDCLLNDPCNAGRHLLHWMCYSFFNVICMTNCSSFYFLDYYYYYILEYVGEEDEVLWPHRPERYGEKTDAREDRPATTWFQDLKEWTTLDIAGASQLATDRERW